MTTRLSVNVNKIATLRNARGGNVPDILAMVRHIEKSGAHGITVHPRPDERHIRRQDVFDIKNIVTTELNCEGYPSEDFLYLMDKIRPEQCTLVPDPPHVLTSNAGWIVDDHEDILGKSISFLKKRSIRVSVFVDPVTIRETDLVRLKNWGLDRIELYTEAYAHFFKTPERDEVLARYIQTAKEASQHGIGINAGHDLNLENLSFFIQKIPETLEVSIGQAFVADCLLYGVVATTHMYLQACC